ncbi:hypothetical protein ACOMHN_009805 [Nucella lapillus]
MMRMQSPRVQCCLCACCVMSAMLGMFMLSSGVCLMLNYNFLDVDTSGLPSDLHNDEGKKVVGIILISVGVFAVILSGVVSTLYFTACGRRQPHASVGPDRDQHSGRDAAGGEKKGAPGRPSSERGAQGRPSSERGAQGRPSSERGAQGRPSSRDGQPSARSQHHHHHHHHKHLHGNGSGTPGRNSPSLSGSRRAGPLPHGVQDPTNRSMVSLGKDGASFSRSGMKSRGHASAAPTRTHRRVKKGRHGQGRYKNPLAPHPEEAGAESQSLGESRRSAGSSRRMQGHVNHGAELDDELEMTQDSVASGGSSGSSSVSRSVIIRVDPSQGTRQSSPGHRRSLHREEEETQFIEDPHSAALSDQTKISRLNLVDDEEEEGDDDYDDEDASERMSRSTMDSQDLSEDLTEEAQVTKRRLDTDILELIS